MLPQAVALSPARDRMWAVRAVVVLLPFVPVIPIKSPFRNHDASSISPATRTPFVFASTIGRIVSGTPGLTAGFASVSTTAAWRDIRKRAMATPLFEAPTTTTRLPASRGGVGDFGS